MIIQRLLQTSAWLLLAYITFVTLSPLGLRPVGVPQHPMYDRVLAYGLLGIFFGLAYPRRRRIPICIVIGAAVAVEGLQALTPDRHAQLADFAAKACGGLVGLLLAEGIRKFIRE